MKVYAILTGWFSEIEGIVDSKLKAQELVDELNELNYSYYATYKEFELR